MKNNNLNAEQLSKQTKKGRAPSDLRANLRSSGQAEAPPRKIRTKATRKEEVDARRVWKQVDDDVVPQLRLSVIDRAVYSYLLRHSHLEGRPRVRFTVAWLANGTRLSVGTTRHSLHRLFDKGALRLVECAKSGHVVQVRLPGEIRGVRVGKIAAPVPIVTAAKLEETDFVQNRALRGAIHARERGRCFYCQRRIERRQRCLDHVVPRAKLGRDSYRNLVSCCYDCNMKKKDRPAEEFLRWLYRERRLGDAELSGRLRALDQLAEGKLKPPLPHQEDSKGS